MTGMSSAQRIVASPSVKLLVAGPLVALACACADPPSGAATATAAAPSALQGSATARRPTPKPRPTTGAEGQFTRFMADNTALASAITDASKEGPDAARRVYEARKDALKQQYDAIKNLPSNAVMEDTVVAFTDNVTAALSDICSLGMGKTIAADRFKEICADYTALLGVD